MQGDVRPSGEPAPPAVRAAGGVLSEPREAWSERARLAFLAEASELLAGSLDEDAVAALAAQLVVPRLARWCAVYLGPPEPRRGAPAARLARVWHADERRIGPLRDRLRDRPPPLDAADAAAWEEHPPAWTFPLRCRGQRLGTLVLARNDAVPSGVPGAAPGPVSAAVTELVADLAARTASAVDTARRYHREIGGGRLLRHGPLPAASGVLPGVETRVVHEPAGAGAEAGGDFSDLFRIGEDRWAFALGDVCGSGPEAAALSGPARHAVRVAARDRLGPAGVLERLNRVLLEETGPRPGGGAGPAAGGGSGPGPWSGGAGADGGRFLSLLYGEVRRRADGGADCLLASAGHPPVLRLTAGGAVDAVVAGQLLLGIRDGEPYRQQPVRLEPGDVLLCVTDGVTERRNGPRLLDDGGGLARLLAGCAGMTAARIAERVRDAVHAFAPDPPDDDLAILALRAAPDAAAG